MGGGGLVGSRVVTFIKFILGTSAKQNCPSRDNLDSVLSVLTCMQQFLAQIVKEKTRVRMYCKKHVSSKLQQVPSSLGEELDLLHRVFIMYDNDKKDRLTLREVCH